MTARPIFWEEWKKRRKRKMPETEEEMIDDPKEKAPEGYMFPDWKDIAYRLETLPTAIRQREQEILKLKDDIDEQDLLIKKREQKIMDEILDEKEDDKPKFRSDLRRKTEFNIRRGKDNQFFFHLKAKDQASKKFKDTQIGLDFLKNKFSTAKRFVDMLKEVQK